MVGWLDGWVAEGVEMLSVQWSMRESERGRRGAWGQSFTPAPLSPCPSTQKAPLPRPERWVRLPATLLILLLLLALPFMVSAFQLTLATEVLILALFATSFNLLFGHTGLLSFGHAAYFSIGAYTSAIVLMRVRPSMPLALAGGMALATLAALVFGVFCVRLDRLYFAMLTLAFGQMVYGLIFDLHRVIGISRVLAGIPRPTIHLMRLSLEIEPIVGYYYLTAGLVVISLFLLWAVVRSPFGFTLRTIRVNPERVEFIGIPVRRYRLAAFVISGAFSGLAGALYAPFLRAVTPGMAFWPRSIDPVLMSLLGGMHTFMGPAVGAVIFITIKGALSSLIAERWMFYLGTLLIALVIFVPGGVVSFVQQRLVPNSRGDERNWLVGTEGT
ncbi:MAG: branched-chain amino acid ABC transporter permease [Anaerolineae bacterium]